MFTFAIPDEKHADEKHADYSKLIITRLDVLKVYTCSQTSLFFWSKTKVIRLLL